MKRIYIALIILLITNPLYPQEVFDTKGREFFVSFMPNVHGDYNLDSLFLFITAETPADGYIEYYNRNGYKFREEFSIKDANVMHIFSVDYASFELSGASSISSLGQCETVASQSFRIVSEKDITVYGLQKANKTSDAFLVLPVDVLGDKYFIMSYNSDGNHSDTPTPSQFVIVAAYDETVVNIRPTTPTYRYYNAEQQVVLNKGDVYLVQALISQGNFNGDLTGTEVLSNKPIAVFSGHMRSVIPINVGLDKRSRDCLIEQLMPVSTWGNNAFITPLTQSNNDFNDGYKDLYRVLAALDNTKIDINGSESVILDKGEFLEREIIGPVIIEASKKILAAVFKKTSSFYGSSFESGDPFMVIIPPKEQFLEKYRVINVNSTDRDQFNSTFSSFNEHYISVTIPVSGISSFLLDGKSVNQTSFKAIGISKYAYANFRVNEGIHNLFSDFPFGIIIYGYGSAHSYGYTGGMGMQPFDSHPPEITSETLCYKSSGIVTDTAQNDKGIESVSIPAGGSVNITSSINRIDVKRFAYTAELTDIYFDGSFQLVARDSSGLKKEIFADIPGFTISSDIITPYKNIVTTFDTLELDKEKCYKLALLNYGSHPKNNIVIKSKSGLINFKSGNTFGLAPNQKIEAEFCLLFSEFGHYIDTIIIDDGCSERKIAAIDIYAGRDEVPPAITMLGDSCSQVFRFSVSDSTRFDIGLKRISVMNNTNCHIKFDIDNSEQTGLEVSVINPFDDAYFKVVIEDSLGNSRTYEQEIPGFTISMNSKAENYNIGNDNIGYRLCDTLMVFNYGKFPIKLDDAKFNLNTLFSMPQSQFPIIVEPDSPAYLIICYNPLSSRPLGDTDRVSLAFNCLEMSLPIIGQPEELMFGGENRCGLPFYITSTEVPNTYFLEGIAPNPAVNTIGITYGIPEESKITIRIYDTFGREAGSIFQGYSGKGFYRIFADLGGLASGSYFVVLSSNKEKTARQFIIE